jgi:hypothetical protein
MGVYLATLHDNYQLRVWTLTESSRWTHWVLKHHVDLEPLTMVDLHDIRVFENTWTIGDDDNIRYYDYNFDDDEEEEEEDEDEEEEEDEDDGEEEEEEEEGEEEEVTSEESDWNSDDDNILNIEDYGTCDGTITFLGFHPYKEVVFLGLRSLVGVAYHLKSLKVQYLGKMRAKDYHNLPIGGIHECFAYTPCMTGKLLKHASGSYAQ